MVEYRGWEDHCLGYMPTPHWEGCNTHWLLSRIWRWGGIPLSTFATKRKRGIWTDWQHKNSLSQFSFMDADVLLTSFPSQTSSPSYHKKQKSIHFSGFPNKRCQEGYFLWGSEHEDRRNEHPQKLTKGLRLANNGAGIALNKNVFPDQWILES